MTYVAWLIFRNYFQKSSDVLLGYIDYVSIHSCCTSLIISVDSILVLFFTGELSATIEIISSSAKLVMSVDRYWDGSVDRWSTGMARFMYEAVVYATSYVIELLCNLLYWIAAVMHEQIVCAIGCLKYISDVFSFWKLSFLEAF